MSAERVAILREVVAYLRDHTGTVNFSGITHKTGELADLADEMERRQPMAGSGRKVIAYEKPIGELKQRWEYE